MTQDDEWCRRVAAKVVSTKWNIPPFDEHLFEVAREDFLNGFETAEGVWDKADFITTVSGGLIAAFLAIIKRGFAAEHALLSKILAAAAACAFVASVFYFWRMLRSEQLISLKPNQEYSQYVRSRVASLLRQFNVHIAQRIAQYEVLALLQDDYGYATQLNDQYLNKTRDYLSYYLLFLLTTAVLIALLWALNFQSFLRAT